MMRTALPFVTRTALAALMATLLAACAPATRVVLLPQEAGKPNAVEVRSRHSSATLNKPYESAVVHTRQDVQTEQLDAKTVNKRYDQLLSAQPAPQERFTLRFEPGGSNLTAESMSELSDILTRATARPGGEIIVTGHTDRTGTVEANDALSRKRAAAIRELLIQRGFDAARVEAVGRGEREPAVPTADNVAEPQNRRAEIVVR